MADAIMGCALPAPDAPCLPPDAQNGVRQLRRLLETGLPVHERPYQLLGDLCGLSEAQVLHWMHYWQGQGMFRRVGLVVRHRALGIAANVMLVMDIDDTQVQRVGHALAQADGVTLCYQRPRRLPDWPYNLFCMIHGVEREAVRRRALALLQEHDLQQRPHALLFSLHAFKQRGARYAGLNQPDLALEDEHVHP